MDLGRMLHKCVRDQWSADDLDWSRPPPELPRDKEEAVVQYFTDMAGIERLAKALFTVQLRNATDPVLRRIFETFVVDEERHAVVAERLARYYDVHHWRVYAQTPELVTFAPAFCHVVKLMSPDIANGYITAGELLLDVALLRSLDDYVGDAMSHEAMQLINRDESRHIAIDYYMTEQYASPEWLARKRHAPRRPLGERVRGAIALGRVMWMAKPFLQATFLVPMDRTDPSGRRTREAFKRIQLLARKPDVSRLRFVRFMVGVQNLFLHPVVGPLLGRVLLRIAGGDERAIRPHYSEAELAYAQTASFEDLANEALAAKHAD